MRKFISILLLLLLLYNSGGYVLIYLNLKEIIKEYAVGQLSRHAEQDSLLTIKIPKRELDNPDVFKWVEENEFMYNNKMYDIAKSSERGDTVYFYCIEDKNEIILDELFAGCFSEDKNETDTEDVKIVLRFLNTEAITNLFYQNLFIPVKQIQYIDSQKLFTSYFPRVITPPPQGFLIA